MNHSTWDLEVHVRETQQRRLHEANRARQIDEARCPADVRHPVAMFSVARLMTFARTWLSLRWTAVTDSVDSVEEPMPSEARLNTLHVAEPPTNRGVQPVQLSQPYTGMVVLARGTGMQTAEQPCGIVDC